MNTERTNFYNVDVNKFKVNPVIEALLIQLQILKTECPEWERDTTETWDIMDFRLKEMIASKVFDSKVTGLEQINFIKMLVLIQVNEISVEQALPILSNWRKFDEAELDYWINSKFVAS